LQIFPPILALHFHPYWMGRAGLAFARPASLRFASEGMAAPASPDCRGNKVENLTMLPSFKENNLSACANEV
jgi:hypothetical protein